MAESRIDELRSRLERDPGSRLFAQLAEQLRRDGDVEEAIGVARAGLERHPKNYPSARLTLGRALLDSGDAAAARVELETAVRDAPDNILASRLLGEALETLGDLEKAVKQLHATLVIAPGDAQIEGRIEAIEAQLAKPQAVKETAAEPAGPDHTKPMKAASLEGAPAAAGGTGPGDAARPATPPEPPAEDDDEGEGGLAPTIRIRMPGDAVRDAPAPMPPSTEAGAREGEKERGQAGGREEETTVPRAVRPTEPAPRAEEGSETGSPEPPPAADKSAGGSAASAPSAGAPEGGETDAWVGEGLPAEDSDRAPTLPTSKVAKYAGADETPPSIPPGVVISPEGLDASPAAEEPETPVETPDTGGEGAAGPANAESAGVSGSLDSGAGGVAAPAASAEAAAPEVTKPPVVSEPADVTSPPVAPASPETTRAPTPPEPAVPSRMSDESAPGDAETEETRSKPVSSATLAELYLQQGLLERAIEVYRELLDEEPGNDDARARVAELEASLRASEAESQTPAGEGGDERAAKRQVLERTIERLEGLLAIVRRR